MIWLCFDTCVVFYCLIGTWLGIVGLIIGVLFACISFMDGYCFSLVVIAVCWLTNSADGWCLLDLNCLVDWF